MKAAACKVNWIGNKNVSQLGWVKEDEEKWELHILSAPAHHLYTLDSDPSERGNGICIIFLSLGTSILHHIDVQKMLSESVLNSYLYFSN